MEFAVPFSETVVEAEVVVEALVLFVELKDSWSGSGSGSAGSFRFLAAVALGIVGLCAVVGNDWEERFAV